MESANEILNFEHNHIQNDEKVDYTKVTVTLGSDDNPVCSLALGHINAVEFDNRWKAEGWNGGMSDNPTPEEIENFTEGIEHRYGRPYEKKGGNWGWEYNLTKDDKGAYPITVMIW